jgi:hypothetical protein
MTQDIPKDRPGYDVGSIQIPSGPQPTNLYDHIDRMRERPALWLGSAELTALRNFIDAYQVALQTHSIDEHLHPPIYDFHDFCARYFQSTSVAGWCNIILADHFGNEEAALGHFFSLFDDFRDRVDVMKGRRIVTAFAREIAFNQPNWRVTLPDFETVLTACREPLCAAFRARIAHEYDAALRAIEVIASTNPSVLAILDAAIRDVGAPPSMPKL